MTDGQSEHQRKGMGGNRALGKKRTKCALKIRDPSGLAIFKDAMGWGNRRRLFRRFTKCREAEDGKYEGGSHIFFHLSILACYRLKIELSPPNPSFTWIKAFGSVTHVSSSMMKLYVYESPLGSLNRISHTPS